MMDLGAGWSKQNPALFCRDQIAPEGADAQEVSQCQRGVHELMKQPTLREWRAGGGLAVIHMDAPETEIILLRILKT